MGTLGADYTMGAWKFGGTVMHSGNRYDDAANLLPIAGYTTLDLHADYAVNKEWTLQASLRNVTDRQYETVRGYNQPGRAAFVTLRWQP